VVLYPENTLATHRKTLSGGIKQFRLKMASTLGVSTSAHSQHFYTEEIQVPTLEHFQKIIDSIEVDLSQFSNDMSYLGFDKNKIANMAAERLGAFRTVKLCLLGGMRGTNLGKILDKSVKVDADIKKVYDEQKIKSNGSGPNDLTMGRLIATFPNHRSLHGQKQCAEEVDRVSLSSSFTVSCSGWLTDVTHSEIAAC